MAVVTLPAGKWQNEDLDRLAEVLGASDGLTRLVGGAVRDTLAEQPVKDVDLATKFVPQDVMDRLQSAGIKVVPTGLAHGTVTAVLPAGPVEITTLRRDVATDGRRATIAFSDDWQEDAARRDFTINALYADLKTGVVFDYFGGVDDLKAGIVRFIGDAYVRIAEDHLRILRFFRFQARYGRGTPNSESLCACRARANDLMALSRERIADELLKLLDLPDPSGVIALMLDEGIVRPVLPEISIQASVDLAKLVSAEARAGIQHDTLRRLGSLLPADRDIVTAVATRLKLSNAARKRLIAMAKRNECDGDDPKALAYWEGHQTALDRMLLGAHDPSQLLAWQPPVFPLTGGDIVKRGVRPGPTVAALLKQVESQWVTEGFPDRSRAEEIADRLIKLY